MSGRRRRPRGATPIEQAAPIDAAGRWARLFDPDVEQLLADLTRSATVLANSPTQADFAELLAADRALTAYPGDLPPAAELVDTIDGLMTRMAEVLQVLVVEALRSGDLRLMGEIVSAANQLRHCAVAIALLHRLARAS